MLTRRLTLYISLCSSIFLQKKAPTTQSAKSFGTHTLELFQKSGLVWFIFWFLLQQDHHQQEVIQWQTCKAQSYYCTKRSFRAFASDDCLWTRDAHHLRFKTQIWWATRQPLFKLGVLFGRRSRSLIDMENPFKWKKFTKAPRPCFLKRKLQAGSMCRGLFIWVRDLKTDI